MYDHVFVHSNSVAFILMTTDQPTPEAGAVELADEIQHAKDFAQSFLDLIDDETPCTPAEERIRFEKSFIALYSKHVTSRVESLTARLAAVQKESESRLQEIYNFKSDLGKRREQIWVLKSERDQLLKDNARMEEGLEKIKRFVPACGENGMLYFANFDEKGEEVGIENVDPLAVIQQMYVLADAALSPPPSLPAEEKGES